jgi:hypothetical protein
MAVKEALRLVAEELGVLEGACHMIGGRTGIAPAFPGEEAEPPVVLDITRWLTVVPETILMLAGLAQCFTAGRIPRQSKGPGFPSKKTRGLATWR